MDSTARKLGFIGSSVAVLSFLGGFAGTKVCLLYLMYMILGCVMLESVPVREEHTAHAFKASCWFLLASSRCFA